MADDSERADGAFSRRTLLARVAFVSAGAVAFRGDPAAAPAGHPLPEEAPAQTRPGEPAVLETLTAAEMATLEAFVARLIPSDDTGPGAAEARAARYIDRALGGALSSSREMYRDGLAALDAYARSSKGVSFDRLGASDQDAVLRAMETGSATGFPDAPGFFNVVRTHTIQGTFGDPFYGGNANFVGWELIAYPGIRLSATAEDQRMDRRPAPVRRSAYDHAMFSKKRPARAEEERRQGVPGDREERRAGVPEDREERRAGVPEDREERRAGVPEDREERRAGVPEDRVERKKPWRLS